MSHLVDACTEDHHIFAKGESFCNCHKRFRPPERDTHGLVHMGGQPTGWVCPKCGAGVAPDQPMCPRCVG